MAEPARTLAGPLPGAAPRPAVPVLPALRTVVPGGLRPGSLVGVAGHGSGSLGLALVAGVSRHGGPDRAGGWCAVVGLPEFGVVAAAGMGAAPERLLLVDDPGDRWADVVAALTEAVDLVLLRPPERPGAAAARRLAALARRHGCVLALAGPHAAAWPGVRLRLRVAESRWEGLGAGHGVLRARRARVTAEGRGGGAWLWLPGPAGEVAPADGGRPRLEVVA
ncbi:hypothetical protein [Actinomadura atramentaria]|uniref:hypothetical protein n=1 Tax=Actinomadura atramentaria TaxID=1990 RepID=UPI0003804254|nr:hypothetical protein [Actinomadura atramentaria]